VNPGETVSAFYGALGRGDVTEVLALLAPELSWTEAERFPYYSGTWTTPQQVLDRLLVPASQDWRGFAARPDRLIEGGGSTVVALGHYGGVNRASGKPLAAPFAHVWEVEDGRITGFRQYTDTALVREAL
jgi:ketosteroid isomerase-like protein